METLWEKIKKKEWEDLEKAPKKMEMYYTEHYKVQKEKYTEVKYIEDKNGNLLTAN